MGKTNKQKFQELSRKEKVEHIKEYYKWHIIGGIITIAIIASLLNTWVFNPPPKSAVSVNFMSKMILSDDVEELENQLNDIIVSEDMGNRRVFVNAFMLGSQDPRMEMAVKTKFAAKLQAKELDIMITDKDVFEELAKQGNMISLDKILDKEDIDKLSDRLIGVEVEELGEITCGIDVSDNSTVKEYIAGDSPKIMSVIVNSQKIEESKKVIKWFLGL